MDFKQLDNKINEFLEKKLYHGAVLQIWKDKKDLYSKSYGYRDYENKLEMNSDTQFLVYSMTKPLTVLTFLKLVDQGLVNLDDNIDDYISEFSNLKYQDENENILETDKKITFRNLLTMTSGIGFFWGRTKSHVETHNVYKKWLKSEMNLQEFVKEIAKIPLLFIPGKDWRYGLSLDVLGALIEVITNKSLEEYIKEEIFKPLKMTRSDFYISDKLNYAVVYIGISNDNSSILKRNEGSNLLFRNAFEPTNTILGGSGLITTSTDYTKLSSVLLDGKTLDKKQFISKELIEEMKKDQLEKMNLKMNWINNEEYSYGLGMRVRTKNTMYPITEIGECGWDGYLGSSLIIDTKNSLTMNLMVSSHPGNNLLIETEFFDELYKIIRE